MFRKFRKDTSGAVVQYFIIAAVSAMLAALIFPQTRFYIIYWHQEMTKEIVTKIGYGDAQFEEGLLIGDYVDHILSPPKITIYPSDDGKLWLNYHNNISFSATQTGAPFYNPVPPFECFWDGYVGYTGNDCDPGVNISADELDSPIHVISVKLCDARGACGAQSREIEVGLRPMEVNLIASPEKEIGSSLYHYKNFTDLSFTAHALGGTGEPFVKTFKYFQNNSGSGSPYTEGTDMNFPRGTHKMQVEACDSQISSLVLPCATDAIVFTVENTVPPKPTIIMSPVASSDLTTDTYITFSYDVDPDLDGDVLIPEWKTNQSAWSTTYPNGTFSYGTHTVFLRMNDGHGGISQEDSLQFTVLPASFEIQPNIDITQPVYSDQPILFYPVAPDGTIIHHEDFLNQCWEVLEDGTQVPTPPDNRYSPGPHTVYCTITGPNGHYVEDTFTFIVNFKVLEIYPVTPQLSSVIDNWAEVKNKIEVISYPIETFNSDNTIDVFDYDMILFGFADCYGNCSSSAKDLTAQRLNDVLEFGNSGRGILLSHDTGVSGHPNFRSLFQKVNVDVSASIISWSGTGPLHKTQGCTVNNPCNDMMNFPYIIPDVIPISHSHSQSGEAKGDVWVAQDKNNAGKTYYLTSNRNWVFTTIGHSVPSYNNLSSGPEEEQKLLINTIFYTSQFREGNTYFSHIDTSKTDFNGGIHSNTISLDTGDLIANNSTYGNYTSQILDPSKVGIANYSNIEWTSSGGNSLEFDGIDDYIQVSEGFNDFSNGFTVEVWAKPTSTNSFERFIDFGNGNANYNIVFARESDTNNLFLEVWNGIGESARPTRIKANGVIENGVYQHFAATIQPDGTTTLYKNGEIVGSGTTPIPSNVIRSMNFIGRSHWENDQYFKGEMAEVRIWNVPRNRTDIRNNMNRALTGNEGGLLGYWKFDEENGSTVYDSSPHGHHGTFGTGTTYYNQEELSRFEFDGSTNYVSVPNSDSVNVTGESITIEAIVSYSTPFNNAFINKENQYEVGLTSAGELKAAIDTITPGNKWGWVYSGYYLEPNTDYHIAVSYDGTRIHFYVNGEKVSSKYNRSNTNNVISGPIAPENTTLSLGYREHNNSKVPVKLSDVRIWNTLRSSVEIQKNVGTTLIGSELGLVAYYTFDNFNGTTLYDKSPFNNHGTIIGTPAYSKIEKISSIVLNGSNYIETKNNIDLDIRRTITLHTRFKVNSLSSEWMPIIYKGTGDSCINGNCFDRTYSLWVNHNGFLHLATNDASGQQSLDTPIGSVQENTWYTVTAVVDRNNGSQKLYINGTLVASSGVRTMDTVSTSNPLLIGWSHQSSSNYSKFNGLIDYVQIWNRTLSASEIVSLTNNPSTSDNSLIAYYDFDEKILRDRTTNGFDMKNVGGEIVTKEDKQFIRFEAEGDYSIVPDNDRFSSQVSNNEITIEAWVRLPYYPVNDAVNQGRAPIIAKGSYPEDWEYALYAYGNGNVGFSFWTPTGASHSEPRGGILPLNEWTHVAGVYKNGQFNRVYINGNLVAEGTSFNGTTQNGKAPLFLARRGHQHDGDTVQELAVDIHEVRIWDYARTESQIQNNYLSTLLGNENGLISFYKIEGSIGEIKDTKYLPDDNYGVVNSDGPKRKIGEKLIIQTNLSLDGGTTWLGWKNAVNNSSIPDIAQSQDFSNARLKYRVLFNNTDTLVPVLHDITLIIDTSQDN